MRQRLEPSLHWARWRSALLQPNSQKGRSADDAPGYTARRSFGKYDVTGRTVTVRKPKQELFDFWRDFSNLSRVMENVQAITISDAAKGRAIWTIKAPAGRTVEVETEIVSEEAGKLIAWRSVEGSQIDTEGRVTFRDAPGDRGTHVSLIIAYKPPAGLGWQGTRQVLHARAREYKPATI